MNRLKKGLSIACIALACAAATGTAAIAQANDPAAISKNAFSLFTQGQENQAVKMWTSVAGKDRSANFYLGFAYQTGRGIEADPKRAVFFYERAAKAGHAAAALNLGEMLAKGEGVVAPNATRAEELIWQAARAGLKQAQIRLAEIYDEGFGEITPKPEMAYQIYNQLHSETREPCYTLRLARMFRDGYGVPTSGPRAKQLYEELVGKKEIPEIALTAREELGLMYYNGGALARNYVNAELQFEKAYDAGSILASRMLGDIYQRGLSDTPNLQRAYEAFERAVEAKDPDSMYRTAVLLSQGELEPDYLRARDLLKEAGRRGLPEAYVELGRLYEHTDVFTNRNILVAWVWYKMALQDLEQGILRNSAESSVAAIERQFDEVRRAEAESTLQQEINNLKIAELVDQRIEGSDAATPLTRSVCVGSTGQ